MRSAALCPPRGALLLLVLLLAGGAGHARGRELASSRALRAPITTASYLASTPDLTYINMVVQNVNFTGRLSQDVAMTFFAPIDDSFYAAVLDTADVLPYDYFHNLFSMTQMLMGHMVMSAVPAEKLVNGLTMKTAQGATLRFDNRTSVTSANPFTPKAKIVRANIRVGQAIIHVVDTVLIPPLPPAPPTPAPRPRGKIGGGLNTSPHAPPPPPACTLTGPNRVPYVGLRAGPLDTSVEAHVARMERLFQSCAVAGAQAQIALSVSQFDGTPRSWWAGLKAKKATPFTTWTAYRAALIKKFTRVGP